MKVKPLGKHFLIRMDKRKDRTEGGIILPDIAGGEFEDTVGVVVERGSAARSDVKPGDRVMLSGHGLSVQGRFEAKVEGNEAQRFVIAPEELIVAVIEE